MKKITLQYFAVLREQAGCSEERFETEAATPAELYAEVQARHGFTLSLSMLRVAVNEEFRDWSSPLAANDRVVFIPPVAGG
jgi:molybdopterin converting factor subunit 1